MYTSTKRSPTRSRTANRSFLYGEMKLTSVIIPLSAYSFETSPILRMFSSRSAAVNPKFEFNPCRMLSPSSTCAIFPRLNSSCSSVYATVDFPDPDRPVNQSTHPRCPSALSRVSRSTAPSCHLMFVDSPTLYASTARARACVIVAGVASARASTSGRERTRSSARRVERREGASSDARTRREGSRDDDDDDGRGDGDGDDGDDGEARGAGARRTRGARDARRAGAGRATRDAAGGGGAGGGVGGRRVGVGVGGRRVEVAGRGRGEPEGA
mmetsp:Transcript_502/g.2036  ORF Transcript_502/g.2036 Transcript_502/m.2036 type:complete len:270 (+) Transcript_502:2072-2881(+)